MAAPDQIIEKWRSYIPPRVSKGDVEKVIKAKFPESVFGKASSHEWVIYCEIAKRAYWVFRQKLDAEEAQQLVSPFNFEGKITVPIFSGREVKREYVKNILEAIDKEKELKEFFKEIKTE